MSIFIPAWADLEPCGSTKEMTTRGKRLLFSGAAVLIILMILPYIGLLTPSALCVHISGLAWHHTTVISHNIPDGPKTFSPPEEIIVSPLRYGPHHFMVKFADGQILWLHYYQTDAGVRRKVDIYLDEIPGHDTISIRAVAYGDKTIYSNTVAASQTSEEKPVDIQ